MRRTIVTLGLTLGLFAAPAGAQPPGQLKQGQKLALLVGVKQYAHTKLAPLRYSENDVTMLAEVLRKAGYQVTVLCDSAGTADPALTPTKANIEKQLTQVLGQCRDRHDTVVVGFAGHGLQFEDQKDAFFCPRDAKPFADEAKTLVSMGQIYNQLDHSFAGVKVLLVDACRNDPKLGKGARSGIDGDNAPRPPRGLAVLFSCAAGEVAYENDQLKHGVFFHFVLEGMKGAAKKGDGAITFHSLADYVADGVAHAVPELYKDEGAQQSPNMKADLIGASPVLLAARLVVPKMKVPPQPLQFAQGTARVESALDLDKDEVEPGNKAFKRFSFLGEAGVTYKIDLHSGAFDAYLSLRDATGVEIAQNDDAGNGSDSRIISKIEKAGTYHILAMSKKGGGKGAFVLNVGRIEATAPMKEQQLIVQQGQPTQVQGQLTAKDDVDAQGKYFRVYKFQAEAGKSYQFVLNGQGGLDPYMRIEDGAAARSDFEDFGDGKQSRLIFTAAQAGVFRAVATTFKPGVTGGFTLIASRIVIAPAKVLALPLVNGKATLNGTLGVDDGLDSQGKYHRIYTFKADAGKSYRFEMTGQDGLDPYVRITSDNGQVLKEEEFGDGKLSRVVFTPNQPGSYRAVVTTFKAGLTGNFTLNVVPETSSVPPPATGPFTLANGQSELDGAIDKQDPADAAGKHYKAYTFKAEKGKSYRFEMTGKNGLDVFVRIETVQGQLLKDEDFGDDKISLSRVLFAPADSGTYRVVATTFKAGALGNFHLSAARVDNSEFKPFEQPGAAPFKLANGQSTLSGTIDNQDPVDDAGKHFKTYQFEAQAGKSYRFEMTGKNGLDPLVRVETLQGQVVQNEDFGDGTVSRAFFKPSQNGVFRVVASTFKNDATGDFTLSAALELNIAPAAAPVAKGKATPFKLANGLSSFNAALTAQDATDGGGRYYKGYTFSAKAGKTYRFEMTGGTGVDPSVRIENEDGDILRNEDFGDGKVSRVFFSASQSGTFRVVATTYKDKSTGGFTLSAAEVETAVQVLTFAGDSVVVNQVLNGTDPVLAGDKAYKQFSFFGEAGKTYRIDLHSKEFDAYLYLKDAAGNTLAENDDAELGKTLDSRIVYKIAKAGIHHIVATTYKPRETGAFTLTVAKNAANVAQEPAGPFKLANGLSSFDGALNDDDTTDGAGKYFKAYSFVAQAGRTYHFEMTGKNGLDPLLRVENLDGQTLKEEDFSDGKVSRLAFTPSQSGTYRVVTSAFKAGIVGGYTLSAKQSGAPAAPPPAKGGALPNAVPFKLANGLSNFNGQITNLDATDAKGKHFKIYTFNAEAGKTYRFEMTGGNGLDPRLRVETQQGQILKEEDFGDGKLSRVVFTPSQAGTYRLVVTTFQDGMVGNFSVSAVQGSKSAD